MITIEACRNGQRCPYLDNIDIFSLYKDWEYFKARVLELEMRLGQTEKENQELRQEKESLQYELKQFREKIFKPRVKTKPSEDQAKRGAPVGHRGGSRKRPKEISECVNVYPQKCDKCGNALKKIYEHKFDEHIVEEIEIKKKTICYRCHYGYCPRCKRVVRLKKKDKVLIMPYQRIGPKARAIGGYLRYLGVPYEKVERIFKDIFDFSITHPSLFRFNAEQAENGRPLYEMIKEKVQKAPWLNADETGWRVKGENWWLWIFTNKDTVLYHIDRHRSQAVVKKILGKKYQGILGSDFYSAYNGIATLAKQRCSGHLLNEIKEVQAKNKFALDSNEGIFCQRLKEVLKHTIEVWNDYHKGHKTLQDLKSEKELAISEIVELLLLPSEHKDIERLRKRLIRHQQELFTFLDNPLIEPTNNRAERQLRPNVIMRKIIFGNQSDKGAEAHQIIMTIIQTGLLNGIKPLDIFRALTIRPLTSYDELPRPP